MIYCSFCCIYVWLDPGTYMIARFMSFYKPGVTCAWWTGWYNRSPYCHFQSNWIGRTWTDHHFLFRTGNFMSRFKSADHSINALRSQLIFIISAGLQYFRPALLWPSINGSECTGCRNAITTAADYNYKSALEYQASALCSNYCSSWWFQRNKEHLRANRIPSPGVAANQALASQQSSILLGRSE